MLDCSQHAQIWRSRFQRGFGADKCLVAHLVVMSLESSVLLFFMSRATAPDFLPVMGILATSATLCAYCPQRSMWIKSFSSTPASSMNFCTCRRGSGNVGWARKRARSSPGKKLHEAHATHLLPPFPLLQRSALLSWEGALSRLLVWSACTV